MITGCAGLQYHFEKAVLLLDCIPNEVLQLHWGHSPQNTGLDQIQLYEYVFSRTTFVKKLSKLAFMFPTVRETDWREKQSLPAIPSFFQSHKLTKQAKHREIYFSSFLPHFFILHWFFWVMSGGDSSLYISIYSSEQGRENQEHASSQKLSCSCLPLLNSKSGGEGLMTMNGISQACRKHPTGLCWTDG